MLPWTAVSLARDEEDKELQWLSDLFFDDKNPLARREVQVSHISHRWDSNTLRSSQLRMPTKQRK